MAKESVEVQPQLKLTVKTSAWSAIPIWWGLIVFCLLPLVAGVLMLCGVVDVAGILAGIEAIPADIQELLVTVVPLVFIALGAIVFIVIVKNGLKAKQVTYEIRDCMLLQKKRRRDVCRLIFKPGMSVSIRQTAKEKFLNYGDVVISVGVGEAAEVTLHKVKSPKKVKKALDRIIGDNCMSFARTMVFNV